MAIAKLLLMALAVIVIFSEVQSAKKKPKWRIVPKVHGLKMCSHKKHFSKMHWWTTEINPDGSEICVSDWELFRAYERITADIYRVYNGTLDLDLLSKVLGPSGLTTGGGGDKNIWMMDLEVHDDRKDIATCFRGWFELRRVKSKS